MLSSFNCSHVIENFYNVLFLDFWKVKQPFQFMKMNYSFNVLSDTKTHKKVTAESH